MIFRPIRALRERAAAREARAAEEAGRQEALLDVVRNPGMYDDVSRINALEEITSSAAIRNRIQCERSQDVRIAAIRILGSANAFLTPTNVQFLLRLQIEHPDPRTRQVAAEVEIHMTSMIARRRTAAVL